MRIIGGKYKGRKISPPRGFRARPTTDFARESLFNILTNRIDFEQTSVLDLFSGTGAMGIEFASRGAKQVDMVEINSRHCAFIQHAVKELKIENSRVIHTNVRTYLKRATQQYYLVFADPPYDIDWLQDIPGLIAKSNIMVQKGQLIVEHPKSVSFTGTYGFMEHRSYGNVNFSFFMFEGLE